MADPSDSDATEPTDEPHDAPDREGDAGDERQLTDEERRRYEAFRREVFGPRCGPEGCG